MSLGIFISVFLFSSGNIIANSYYNGKLKEIDEMSDNVVILSSYEEPSVVKESMSKLTHGHPINLSTMIERKAILSTKVDTNKYVSFFAYIHGISNMNSMMPIITTENLMLPVETQLIKGRTIQQADITNEEFVVVIDEFTEKALFSGDGGLGKYIDLNIAINDATFACEDENDDERDLKFKVIGVVKNSYNAELSQNYLRRALRTSKENIYIDVSIYVPISIIDKIGKSSEVERRYLYNFDDKGKYDGFVEKLDTFADVNSRLGKIYSFSIKEEFLEDLHSELSLTKKLINVISLILCLISGISIMSIIFFSIKERISEIGIRKAFGASKLDIVFQFMFEMILIAFLASIIAILASYFFCQLIQYYLSKRLFIDFNPSISLNLILSHYSLGPSKL